MKAYSGSTSEGFLPALPGAIPAATATAPAPDDPSVSFTDFLQQQAAASPAWATHPTGAAPNPSTRWPNLAADPSEASFASAPVAADISAGSTAAGFFAASPAALNWPKLGAAVPGSPAGSSRSAGLPDDEAAQSSDDDDLAAKPGSPVLTTSQPPSFPGAGWKSAPTSVDPTDLASTENAVPSKTAASPASSPTSSSPARDALAYFVASQNVRPAAPPPSTNETAEAATSNSDGSEPSPSTTDPEPLPLLSLAHYLWLSQATPAQASQQPVSAGATASRTAPSLSTALTPFHAAQLPPASSLVGKSAASAPHSADPADPAPGGTVSSAPAQPELPPDSPLAVLLAQATSLAAGARPQSASSLATASRPTPAASSPSGAAGISTVAPLFPGSARTAAASPFPEKKSAEGEAKRSFIQASSSAGPTPDASAQLLAGASAAQAQDVFYQAATSTKSSPEKGLSGASSAAAAAAGTTNGKKEVDMNATLEMPDLVVSSGTNPLVARTPADVHILLGTNHDFHEAIEQVMHVAELSNLSLTSNPLRVAIEIQTPPGAIVNVYVSRQADSSYRAQLSTEDVQALGWVQDQIGALKGSTSTGTDIRWAPAQLDISPTATPTASSANGGNLDWNRGGNQGGNEPSDERPSRSRSTPSQDEEEAELGLPFLETLGAIGSAA